MSKRKETPDVMSQLQGLAPIPAPAPAPTPAVDSRPVATREPEARRELRREGAPRKNLTPASRLVGRATYDLGEELKEAIRRESVELGVPASQLAKYLLLYAWDFYVGEEIPRPTLLRSDSPKFRHTIDFGE